MEYEEVEKEFYLPGSRVAEILRDMAEQVENGRIKFVGEGWEFEVEYVEPVKFKVKYEKGEKDELKVKIEFKGGERQQKS